MLTIEDYSTRLMARIWNAIDPMPYMLDDSLHNPYTLEHILFAPSSATFLLGDPPGGIMWAHSIEPGHSAGCAMAMWDFACLGATSSVRLAIKAVMRKHSLHRIWALVAAPNRSSLKLTSRLGFQKEGLIREGMCYRGVWTDCVVMGLLASEVS